MFPETKGRTLEEIAVVFDGEIAHTAVHRRLCIGVEVQDCTVNNMEKQAMHKERGSPDSS